MTWPRNSIHFCLTHPGHAWLCQCSCYHRSRRWIRQVNTRWIPCCFSYKKREASECQQLTCHLLPLIWTGFPMSPLKSPFHFFFQNCSYQSLKADLFVYISLGCFKTLFVISDILQVSYQIWVEAPAECVMGWEMRAESRIDSDRSALAALGAARCLCGGNEPENNG